MVNNSWPKMKTTTSLANEFSSFFNENFQKALPVISFENGSIKYKNFLIKKLSNQNWGVFDLNSKILKNQYYLKSCALLAAYAYSYRNFNKCTEIKNLDDTYWSNYSDSVIFKHLLNKSSDDNYPILLTRLEESMYKTSLYKNKISKLFKNTF